MKETFRDKVMSSPEMTEDMWGEMATLFGRYTCIRSFFGYVLAEANSQLTSLPNISSATEEGREQLNLIKGAIKNGQWIVGNSCDLMGDRHVIEREDDEPKGKRAPPVKKRARAAPAKRSRK